jgi:hypothetical protein
MNFGFNIAVHNHSNDEVQLALTTILESWGFKSASPETVKEVGFSLENLFAISDEQLTLRRFLLSPPKNQWGVIYHSLNWFSEAQELGVQLSKVLEDLVLIFLWDDSYGWGYELAT